MHALCSGFLWLLLFISAVGLVLLFQNIVFNIVIAFLYFLCFVLSCLVICLFVFVQCIMKAVREGLHGANELYWAVNTEATRVMRPHRTCINSLL